MPDPKTLAFIKNGSLFIAISKSFLQQIAPGQTRLRVCDASLSPDWGRDEPTWSDTHRFACLGSVTDSRLSMFKLISEELDRFALQHSQLIGNMREHYDAGNLKLPALIEKTGTPDVQRLILKNLDGELFTGVAFRAGHPPIVDTFQVTSEFLYTVVQENPTDVLQVVYAQPRN